MTGWGQEGPLAKAAGHDINYIAISGALAAIGPADGVPVPPLNLVGDYGGGALYLVAGLLAALLEAQRSGRGQVVDVAMCDGVINMMTLFHSLAAEGRWTDSRRAANLLDGGAPYYRTYECSDGKFIAVGALEPQFYALLRKIAGLDGPIFEGQGNPAQWPAQSASAADIFRSRTRDEWCAMLEGTDACVSPVLAMGEVAGHPHVAARGSLVEIDGVRQSAPAPRFARTPGSIRSGPPEAPGDPQEILREWEATSPRGTTQAAIG